jgi:hypothetical protein
MHGSFGNPEIVAREIGGHFRPGKDKIVAPRYWVVFAKQIFPEKTALHIAMIVHGKDATESHMRAAQRWLSGEFDPPIDLMRFFENKLYERLQ